MAVVNTSNLLVPINLDALVVNNSTNLWKNLSLDLDKLSKKNYKFYGGLGYYLEKSITYGGQKNASDNGEIIIPNGIHLHWTLPDAFRRGEYNDDGSLVFPSAPNRWLVVRMDNNQRSKLWIVESDTKSTDKDAKNNWIKEDEDTQTVEPVSIGNKALLKDWTEKKASAIPLTIMAPGNPDFAASYMHCKNVFGLYDDMKDDNGREFPSGMLFTYQVFGWFADAAANPLAGVKTNDELINKLSALSWSLPNANTIAAGGIPDNIVCHAMINTVLWNKKPASTIPQLSNIKVGIGNSLSEALASLLPGHTKTDQSNIPDKLLAAYQYKSIVDHGIEGNGLNLIKKQIHARGFLPVNGGTNWVIEAKSKDNVPESSDNTDLSLVAYNTTVSAALAKLNELQTLHDNLFNSLTSLQAELYALKYKKVFGKTIESNTEMLDPEMRKKIQSHLNTSIQKTIEGINIIKKELNTLKRKKPAASNSSKKYEGAIEQQCDTLKEAMLANGMADYVIKEVPMPKFFEPADPAVVIAGLNPASKYINKDAKTACRVKSHLLNKIIIGNKSIKPDKIALDITNDMIRLVTAKTPDGIGEMICESLLLNPLMASRICNVIGNDPKDVENIKQVILRFADEPGNFKRVDDAGKEIPAYIPQASAIVAWKQPWNPLYLEWSLKWESSYKSINPGVLSAWKFGDKKSTADFKYNLKSAHTANNIVEYSGRTLLSSQLADKVKNLNAKIENNFGTGLFNNFIPMSQTLSGFSSQLLMRYHGVQLPILNENLKLDTEHEHIGDQYSWSPMMKGKPFYPVRSGTLRLSMLRVIDSFGQVLDVLSEDRYLHASASKLIKNSAGIPQADQKYLFELAPRIIQPARLKFDWKSANPAHNNRITDSDPATSPVCGWFLHNKLDDDISIYDSSGIELGILAKNDKTKIVELVPPPGSSQTAPVNIPNQTLNNVVNFILDNEGAFESIKKQITAVTKKIQSKASREQLTVSLPIGFPLAVVTAQFVVELKDLAAKNQSWNPGLLNKQFDGIDYTVNIGNALNKADGLSGYFLNNNYNDFILPYGEVKGSKLFHKTHDTLFKTGVVNQLTLLMDPRTMVSLSSGILPSATFELPQHAITKALKSINLRFIAAPVITPVGPLKVPLLQNDAITWDFIRGTEKQENLISDPGKNQLRFDPLHATEGWLKMTERK